MDMVCNIPITSHMIYGFVRKCRGTGVPKAAILIGIVVWGQKDMGWCGIEPP